MHVAVWHSSMLDTKFPGPTKCPFVLWALVMLPPRKHKHVEEIFQCEKCHWFRRLPARIHHPFDDGKFVDKDVYDCAIPLGYFVNAESVRTEIDTLGAVQQVRDNAEQQNREIVVNQQRLVSIFTTALAVQQDKPESMPKPQTPQLSADENEEHL